MKTWCRKVLPPEHYVVFALLILSFIVGMGIWQELVYPGIVRFPFENPATQLALAVFAGAYGIFRVVAFHPASRPDYLAWLKTTPWRPGLPLPVGPLHLAGQDVMTVGLLMAATLLFKDNSPLLILQVFLVSYLLTHLLLLTFSQAFHHAYWMALLWGGIVLLCFHPLAQFLLFALLYGITLHGLRISLNRIERWDAEFLEKQLQFSSDIAAFQETKWGWPFDSLSPERANYVASVRSATALSLLVGWWSFVILFVISSKIQRRDLIEIASPAGAIGVMLVLIRLYRYLYSNRPPISLMGRLLTFRWIIPRFDVVFVGPLLILGVEAGTFTLCSLEIIPFLWGIPVMITLQFLIFFLFPPSLDEWRMTGAHRIVPPSMQQSKSFQITQ